MKGVGFFIVVLGILLALGAAALPAEKLKFGTSVREHAAFYLPILAAEEKGFWKANNLEVEWFPFRSGVAHLAAVAAGEITIGFSTTGDLIQGVSRGLPMLILAELWPEGNFVMWVRSDSRIKEPKDLGGQSLEPRDLVHPRISMASWWARP